MKIIILCMLTLISTYLTTACSPSSDGTTQANLTSKHDVVANQPQRPFIWARASERSAILDKIEHSSWARELFQSLKSRADEGTSTNLKQRKEKLLALPLVWSEELDKTPTLLVYGRSQGNHTEGNMRWGHPREPQIAMLKGLQDAVDCSVIFYLTQQENYAQCAADMLSVFITSLNQTKLGEIEKGKNVQNNGWLYPDNHLLEARIIGAQLPIIYDFIYSWLKQGGQIYDLKSDMLKDFDFDAAQQVFKTYVELALNRGLLDSNWPVLESASLLHNMHALDDGDEIVRLLPFYLYKDTAHQASLKRISKNFEKTGDIWPESLSYSRHVTRLTIYLMTLVDRIYPNLKLGQEYPNITQSLTAMYNLQFPNDAYPYNGDTHRYMATEYLTYEMALKLASINGNEQQSLQFSKLLTASMASGDYHRGKLEPRHYDPSPYVLPLQLLWSIDNLDEPAEIAAAPTRPRSNYLPYAGITVQRNMASKNPTKNSLMSVVSGGSYIHGHATGMDLELYGQGYVLGIDGGKWTYGTDIHENYYRLFAAHNSVISNGASASHGGWINLGINTVETQAIEPEYGKVAVSDTFSFATTTFDDKFNLIAPAQHERTVALVRLSGHHAYYLDVYRARSDTPSQFHDYVYHNVGDDVSIESNGEFIAMKDDPSRYHDSSTLPWTYHSQYRHPGWHFFEEVKSTAPSHRPLLATFTAKELTEHPVVMRALIPGGLNTEVTKVNAPQSKAAPPPYDKKPLPTLLLRHHGETWSNPFVVAYESHTENVGNSPALISVERLISKGIFKGVQVTAEVDGQRITQYIVLQEKDNDVYENEELALRFEGRFAAVTIGPNERLKELYIGRGRTLVFNGKTLSLESPAVAAYKRYD
ncbi:hypothetical protein [Echinimonas agarilytica]|uniref:Heparinase II/III-like protein n=1 Tax=Echinimonas agarilytica TaxID=1215918 RepID=A0AA41W858_9GAMM|nr:hypothetical protein [Echinimonas agarilytica]MCM2680705.1 hypothetical protein [Echinimonas agarilytica]